MIDVGARLRLAPQRMAGAGAQDQEIGAIAILRQRRTQIGIGARPIFRHCRGARAIRQDVGVARLERQRIGKGARCVLRLTRQEPDIASLIQKLRAPGAVADGDIAAQRVERVRGLVVTFELHERERRAMVRHGTAVLPRQGLGVGGCRILAHQIGAELIAVRRTLRRFLAQTPRRPKRSRRQQRG